MIMNADAFTDADVLAAFSKALNQSSIEDIERNRASRRRVAKPNFSNLKRLQVKINS